MFALSLAFGLASVWNVTTRGKCSFENESREMDSWAEIIISIGHSPTVVYALGALSYPIREGFS